MKIPKFSEARDAMCTSAYTDLDELVNRHLSDPRALELLERIIADVQRDNPWKDALEQTAIVHWTLTATNRDDPAQMLADLLAQARREALDPAISQDAVQLQAAAYERAAQAVEAEFPSLNLVAAAVRSLATAPEPTRYCSDCETPTAGRSGPEHYTLHRCSNCGILFDAQLDDFPGQTHGKPRPDSEPTQEGLLS